MPEPVTATEGEQGEATATAPQQQAADKPTTTQPSEGQPESSDFKSVADLLDIPPELQSQILPKADKPETETEPAEPKSDLPEEEIPEEVKGKEVGKDEEEESDEDEPPDEEKEEKPAAQKIDKRQKRINRLTRKTHELEDNLDQRDSTITELREKLTKFEKQAPTGMVPKVGPWMPDRETADTYGDLAQKKQVAKAKLEWCDKHRDGVTIVENGAEKFISSDEITDWRRDATESLMEVNPQIAVIEREAKQTFRTQKAQFDKAAVTFWPELGNKSSQDYQLAASILEEYPDVKHSPAAQYAVGLVIEGMKSLQAKISAANGKSPQAPKKHRDLDERVFTTPRVPIAPHTPGPPTREATPSSHKKLEEAKNRLMEDQDGSAESLAKVFAARDEIDQRRQPTSRSPVRS